MGIIVRRRNESLREAALRTLEREQPMTLRQLYYRLVSSGDLDNRRAEYQRLGTLLTRLREGGDVPFTWLVDHVRATLKPPSWSGLEDYADTVRRAYRKNLWASQNCHLEVLVEKDAVAGTIQPITHEFDVGLRVCRGYSSVSFAGEIASLWKRVKKPVACYYLGDFDPSGFDIERDLIAKLERYSDRLCAAEDSPCDEDEFGWTRLAIQPEDFELHNLIPLPVKRSDCRHVAFLRQHGTRCAEVDALPPTELRHRIRAAIEGHIDPTAWERLQLIEDLERQSLLNVLRGWGEDFSGET